MNQSDIFTGQLRLVSRLKYLFDPLGFDVVYKIDDRNPDPLTCRFNFVIASRKAKETRKIFDITGGGIDRLLEVVGEVEEFCTVNSIPVNLSNIKKQILTSLSNEAEAIASGVLFELRSPDGHVWRLYENGKIEGFPERTLVINYAAPVLDALRSRYIQQIKERSHDQKIGVKLTND